MSSSQLKNNSMCKGNRNDTYHRKSNKPKRTSKPEVEMDMHHRRPRSIGGDSRPSNLSWVKRKKHCAWPTLFQSMTAQQIVTEINELWLDPRYKMVLIPQFTSKTIIVLGEPAE